MRMKRHALLFALCLGLFVGPLSAQLIEELDYEIRTREESVAPAVPWPDMTVEMEDFLGDYFSFPFCWGDEGEPILSTEGTEIEIKVVALTMSAAGTMARGPMKGEVENGEVVSCFDERLYSSLKGMVQMGPEIRRLVNLIFDDNK
jgi:hypothetical protein